jgi:adenosylcobinamide kinase/adenosylcobinamide-phosphate guanylyltransferase
MPHVILVTGGCRSGKSVWALQRARSYAKRAFVATAEAFDDEMRARIARHREERGAGFHTVEAPCDLAEAVRGLPAGIEAALIDCLTVWLGNLMHRHGPRREFYPEVRRFLELLDAPPCDLIVVTNEVGLGIVPGDAASRAFRDLAGLVNQEVARRAHTVVMTVSGLPLTLKGDTTLAR